MAVYSEWGFVKVGASAEQFKDAIVTPFSVREWDWKKTGTSHSIGTQFQDFELEYKKYNPTHVILSTGYHKRLAVNDNVRHISNLEVYDTSTAVQRYNSLVENVSYVPLIVIHSTC